MFEYWQFWRNTEDADVGRFLKFFTDLPVEECERLGALQGAEINEAKKILATEATAICHGRDAALAAAETARQAFETGSLAADLPSRDLPRAELEAGIPAFKLFGDSGLVTTNSEARRLIRGGGARLNDLPIQDENRVIGLDDLVEGVLKLSSGKKRHLLLRPI